MELVWCRISTYLSRSKGICYSLGHRVHVLSIRSTFLAKLIFISCGNSRSLNFEDLFLVSCPLTARPSFFLEIILVLIQQIAKSSLKFLIKLFLLLLDSWTFHSSVHVMNGRSHWTRSLNLSTFRSFLYVIIYFLIYRIFQLSSLDCFLLVWCIFSF